MNRRYFISRRVILALVFALALITAGFAAPKPAAALALPSICGYYSGSVTNSLTYSYFANPNARITITMNDNFASFFELDGINPKSIIYNSGVIYGPSTTYYQITLPSNTSLQLVFFTIQSASISVSCDATPAYGATYGATIANDGRLNNGPDQGAQSVAVYCNADGSLTLLPLQLNNPPPGASQVVDKNGKKISYTTAPLKQISKSAVYGDITIGTNSDGSWTVYRQELSTAKPYSFLVTKATCPQK